MKKHNEDSWDNRVLGSSEDHVVAVSLDLEINEVLIQQSASPAVDEYAELGKKLN